MEFIGNFTDLTLVNYIKIIQEKLHCFSIDGLAGNETKEKCKIFQAEVGLVCDRNMSEKRQELNYFIKIQNGIFPTLNNLNLLVSADVVLIILVTILSKFLNQ